MDANALDPAPGYRRYRLEPMRLARGWSVRLLDPAGHGADVVLHEQLGHPPWATAEEALAAARGHIDHLLGEESSY